MSGQQVSINNLTKAITDVIESYTDDVQRVLDEATEKYTSKALREIKKKSPTDTGDYKEGWTKKVSHYRGFVAGTVYNKTDYQLIHLLEFGHANVYGGRTLGRTPAHPHVAVINEEIAQKFILEVTSKL